ncbi:MAG: class I SAM-dependent methyltransferase [Desulfobacteraceae bacterium]
MSDSLPPYIKYCPVGCHSGLEDSDIVLAEGPLQCCIDCGQLVSRCSEDLYWKSMDEFDDPKGTWPTGKAADRLLRHTKQILTRVERFLGKKRGEIRLLDVGCSNGAFISTAQSLGIHAEGVEPSAAPAQAAIASGLEVHQGFLQDIHLPESSFDVVTLFEIIEHLKDPLSLFKECHRVLHKGGLLVIRTGNTDSWTAHYRKDDWEYFSISEHGGHISFFNPVSMGKLAERSGFSVERLKTHRVSFYQKGEVPFIIYRPVKFLAELLNTPSTWFGKGHELQVFLRKQDH